MESKQMSIKRLNEILEATIDSINGTKDEIFEIVNHSRLECKRLEDELKSLQTKIKEVFTQVERLEGLDKKSRVNLSHKSKNFEFFNESDIKDAYDLANGIRIELLLKREEEKNLIERRKEIEIRLKNSYEVYKKAENINKQITVAVEYLMGNAGNIAVTVDELSKKHYMNIKIIEAQEEERSRLARDIHDGPAQSLANVIVKAELCEKLLDIDKDRAKNEIHSLKEVIRWTLKDVRKIIYDLRPMSLDDLGLIPTLERYISIFEEDTAIKVVLKTSGKFNDLESVIQIAIFRIIQESLSNIRKHAKAKSAVIIIEKSLSKVNLSIKDDGVGFNIENYKEGSNLMSSGFGLMNIKERVELLNGSLHIISSLNLGTKISLFIPLNGED
ncbi:sensor histidine kinase [Tissierella praeacuta]|uniref:sensor histidine kinase n=1 Tax=Tissierella praeacuta TaxID=43131 RepID=UPI000EC95384|nr:sensor histidine kinase [Tissierella praeacuta]MBU5255383.1 sensor histidine kinase [Tissierella praeacuta]HAE92669.1 histidine kinase [Tissierella sp.]